jgi:hypothetical protein
MNFSYDEGVKFRIIESLMIQISKEREHISILVNNCGKM